MKNTSLKKFTASKSRKYITITAGLIIILTLLAGYKVKPTQQNVAYSAPVTYQDDETAVVGTESVVSEGVVGSKIIDSDNTYLGFIIPVYTKTTNESVTKESIPKVVKRGVLVQAYASETVSVPYQQDIQQDGSYYSPYSFTQQSGSNGSKTVTYKALTLRGNEVSKTVVSETVNTQPSNQVVIQGTRNSNYYQTGDLDCGNFRYQQEAEAVYMAGQYDYHRLDGDQDGIACESLPRNSRN
jgi:uncharacterized protein YabE (DUF348 family)